jgi:hypothetical protein
VGRRFTRYGVATLKIFEIYDVEQIEKPLSTVSGRQTNGDIHVGDVFHSVETASGNRIDCRLLVKEIIAYRRSIPILSSGSSGGIVVEDLESLEIPLQQRFKLIAMGDEIESSVTTSGREL